MTEDKQSNNKSKKINTSGGSYIEGNENIDAGDFVGQDKVINQVGKTLRDEQYQIILKWCRRTKVQKWLNLGGRESFRAFDLARRDLSDLPLTQADLKGANLTGAILNRANLNRANLSGADLTGADLYMTNLSGANLNNANLTAANLSGAILSGAILNRANLSGADLTGADLWEGNLFIDGLGQISLAAANLTGAKYDSQTKWPDGFIPPKLTEDKQSDNEGKKIDTGGGASVGNDLNTSGGLFIGRDQIINQVGKALRDEQYQIVLEWEKYEKKPRLREFDLAKRNLAQLNLAGADLWGADLTGAYLAETNLSGANFCGANLTGANLNGVNLTGAKYDSQTKWPDGFVPPESTETVPDSVQG